MDGLQQRYLDNLRQVRSLAKPRGITVAGDRPQTLANIRTCAHKTNLLHLQNDELLDQLVYYRRAEELTAEDASQLEAFARALFSYTRSDDTGVAYRIYQLLYEYARLHNDRDLLIRTLYFQGITLFYLNLYVPDVGVNVLGERMGACFKEGASYFSQYAELSCTETRGYVLRCMGNLRFAPPVKCHHAPMCSKPYYRPYEEYQKVFHSMMAVIHDPHYRALDPDMPWDSFEYSLHMDRTSFLTELRETPNAAMARDVLESARFSYAYQERAAQLQNRVIPYTIRYVYEAARFHAGEISAEALVESLLDYHDEADPRDFSDNSLYLNIRVPLAANIYSSFLTKPQHDRLAGRLQRALTRVESYLMAAPQNEYYRLVSNWLGDVSLFLASFQDTLQDRLLHCILACHPPTYVHSRLVAFLCHAFFEEMVRRAPHLLVGTLGMADEDAVRAHGDMLCGQAYECGLYHDVGKSLILDAVGLYGRRLLPEEFLKIQMHPCTGWEILRRYPDMEAAACVALYHHQFWDGHGGYLFAGPACPAQMRRLVSVTSVADSIDAGTDNVGRSYGTAKTFDDLVEELYQGSGTRYDPDVVDLLDDAEFRSRLQSQLTTMRQDVYCDVYEELESLC